MRYVAGYLLASMGGNITPKAKDIQQILDSVGVETDYQRLEKVIAQLEGKNIEDVMKDGLGKLATFNSGSGDNPALTPKEIKVDESPVPESKDEIKEETDESDDDLGFGLFD